MGAPPSADYSAGQRTPDRHRNHRVVQAVCVPSAVKLGISLYLELPVLSDWERRWWLGAPPSADSLCKPSFKNSFAAFAQAEEKMISKRNVVPPVVQPMSLY